MATPAAGRAAIERWSVRVEGIVQGVGFRPFVHGLATRLGLAGWVRNDTSGVLIEAEGPRPALAELCRALRDGAPRLASIHAVSAESRPLRGDRGFAILESAQGGGRDVLVPADTATCEDCLRELFDPSNRRYRYAFTNCTSCGPRYSIITGVPYDRRTTTMTGFAMCADCAAEYGDPANRRFHAEPVCCPACGPRLRLVGAGAGEAADPIAAAASLLAAGAVVAVKGLGGYHLSVDATNDAAVRVLRHRKGRPERPLAVMVADLSCARRLCAIGEAEADLLTSARRPVVLTERRDGAALARSVAPGLRRLGLLLAYTPVHHLLANALGRPFVCTSGNRSGEPIAYRDDDALERLGPLADAFLTHDRPIHARIDDSVTTVARGRELRLRRARGDAPAPFRLPTPAPRPLLACGAQLKSTFTLAKGAQAFLSPHVGDLEGYETLRSFAGLVEHFTRLFGVAPELAVHDLHPDYPSTRYALEETGLDTLAVQHHRAHLAACLVDNGLAGPVIGLVLDGLGYGDDGTLWGGELLVGGLEGAERAGHLATVPMPGGEAAVREPWRMAAAWLERAYGDDLPRALAVVQRHGQRFDHVVALARAGVNAPITSSAGRLFDAVAALVGVRDAVTYEGQAAAELEQLADPSVATAYPCGLRPGAPLVLAADDLVRSVADDLHRGVAGPVVASRFHNGLAAGLVAACRRLRDETGLATVALSGGVFQNLLLLERTTSGLEDQGFQVLRHRTVPPNDGGISLGQAAIAAAGGG